MRLFSRALILALSCLSFMQAAFAEGTPVGLWRTYDLSGTARSIVKFSIVNNKLRGRIVKVLAPPAGKTISKGKVGTTVVWGLYKEGDGWVGGQVLDTDTGSTYRCNVTVSEDNRTLHLQAYVATPILGRTVDWDRVSE